MKNTIQKKLEILEIPFSRILNEKCNIIIILIMNILDFVPNSVYKFYRWTWPEYFWK